MSEKNPKLFSFIPVEPLTPGRKRFAIGITTVYTLIGCFSRRVDIAIIGSGLSLTFANWPEVRPVHFDPEKLMRNRK
jgi:hypothetical protein